MADESKPTSSPEVSEVKPSSSSGLDPKIVGLLCWLFAPITSLIFMVMEDMKKDDFIQSHAKQSLIVGIVHMVVPVLMFLMFIPVVGWILGCIGWLLSIGLFVLRIVYAVKAYGGEKVSVPLISDMAK